jgi:hypothetical protein
MPSQQPSSEASSSPSSEPSEERASVPSLSPSDEPSSKPSMKASEMPSSNPSSEPSSNPSNGPSSLPSTMLSQSASPTGTGLPLVYKGENLESYYECEGDCDDSRDCDVSCILNTLYEVARFKLDTDISELTTYFFAPMLRLVGSQLLRAIWYPKRPRMQWDRSKRKRLLLCTSGWGTCPHGQQQQPCQCLSVEGVPG